MMKKTIIASMVLAVGLLASPVMASEQSTIDYDSMSTEELVALRDEINAQIADRGGDNVIGHGNYVVGVDIKASNFKALYYSGDDDDNEVVFRVYENQQAFDDGDWDHIEVFTVSETDKGGAVLNLKEGEILKVFGSAIIEEVSPSWAPED